MGVVDADGNDRVAVKFDGAAQALEDLAVEADDVPERAAGQVGARIVEAVDFLKFEFREVGAGGDDSAAARAQVHGDEGF
jgi:hypothetical protein